MNDDIIKADSYDFDRRIENGIVMVYFYDELDVHCRAMEPVIEEVADVYYDYIRVVALEVEQSPDTASVFAIEELPTVIIFKDGKIAERITGMNPPVAYENAIEELL